MPARIYPKRPPKIYPKEWREALGLSQQQVADRLGTTDVTIGRWEGGSRRPDLGALTALCEALGISPGAIYRHPDTPSADDQLRDQPQDVVDQVFKVIKALRK